MVNNNLSEVRKTKGLTQEGLAEKSGVSRVTIANIERGAVTDLKISTMLSLANALGATVEISIHAPRMGSDVIIFRSPR